LFPNKITNDEEIINSSVDEKRKKKNVFGSCMSTMAIIEYFDPSLRNLK
jgi:hypothetical protein